MATVNGNHLADGAETQRQGGKRKRSSSPKLELDEKITAQSGLSEDLMRKVRSIIQDNDPNMHLLDYPLASSSGKDGPATKRRRTQSATQVTETIGTRLHGNTYKTIDQLLNDLDEVQSSLTSQVNGHRHSEPISESEIDRIRGLVVDEEQKFSRPSTTKDEPDDALQNPERIRRPALQLLSLRGQTDGGVRQLFTGLPKDSLGISKDADTKQLPNGFELIDSALMNVSTPTSKDKDNRTFGDVFTSYRSMKSLEPPRQARTQDKQLNFVPLLSNLGFQDKQDYRNTALGTGTWLSYATLNVNRVGGDVAKSRSPENAASSLFKAAFTSFAPSVDHSMSVITEHDHSRSWFKLRTMRTSFEEDTTAMANTKQSSGDAADDEPTRVELGDDLDEIVQNYVSEAELNELDESEKLLSEISDLVQTLSSYQAIRDLDNSRRPGSKSTPTQPEIDTYELLRTQLQLVIDALPPHAVSKLNGDQMAALNITTNLIFSPPEIIGTAQADDFTLRKQRGTHVAGNVMGRTPTLPARPNYATPNPAYGQQAQAYGQNSSLAASYAARPPAVMYNTPRPGIAAPVPPHAQSSYRTSSTPYTNPVGQSYSQTSNGKYSQPYVARASQPGYQQRAQDRASTWQRPDSPQKTPANGQNPQQYQTRPYATPSQGFVNSPMQGNSSVQQKLLEQMRQQSAAASPEGTV